MALNNKINKISLVGINWNAEHLYKYSHKIQQLLILQTNHSKKLSQIIQKLQNNQILSQLDLTFIDKSFNRQIYKHNGKQLNKRLGIKLGTKFRHTEQAKNTSPKSAPF